ncbi:biotin synthase BioB [Thalassorhabdus alkalitolerans]|uniref:Biotin synthase n=1 Tax=Thalassorhabdus alkalitolerans TaxID=2282697 RepID=A0ABW0YIN4_9BACI
MTLKNGWNEWGILAEKGIRKETLSKDDALAVLRADEDEVLSILDAAFKVRKHFYGKKVKLNMIVNAKSGLCPEDCGYCSQSSQAQNEIDRYPLLEKEALVKGAEEAMRRKAGTYCIVASGRGPTDKEVEHVASAVEEITAAYPLKICACLGILKEHQAVRLKEAGVHRYNHNLNTHKDHHGEITTTHTYEDRVGTVNHAKEAGLSPCSGLIAGMGETDEQLIEALFALRELDADSIPINLLHPIPGTKLENQNGVGPMRSLKILALSRFILPHKEIRVSGGREVNLRSLQPLALYAANSIFVGDYLTTGGQIAESDHQMIKDLGFDIEENALEDAILP